MNNIRQQKAYNSQLNKMIEEAETMKVTLGNLQREYQAKKSGIQSLRSKINRLKADETPRVSEHAILRYLERVNNINVEEIEKVILNDSVLKMMETLGGDGKYPLGEFQLVVQNYTVVTIV